MAISPSPPHSSPPSRFETAIVKFDAANSQDPNHDTVAGSSIPRELLYAQRLSAWVDKLAPQASEPLRLAARCQHLCRWEIPRNSYEPGRAGYLRWRNYLKKMHAARSGDILKEAGYPDDVVHQVQALNLKSNFPSDPDSQILEDALCLLFLEFQLEDFARRTPEEKVVNALRKSWNKMSERARDEALKLSLSPSAKNLIQAALDGSSPG